jgi:hypothetical protein
MGVPKKVVKNRITWTANVQPGLINWLQVERGKNILGAWNSEKTVGSYIDNRNARFSRKQHKSL